MKYSDILINHLLLFVIQGDLHLFLINRRFLNTQITEISLERITLYDIKHVGTKVRSMYIQIRREKKFLYTLLAFNIPLSIQTRAHTIKLPSKLPSTFSWRILMHF